MDFYNDKKTEGNTNAGQSDNSFIIGRNNIIVMAAAAVMIIVGFALMAGAPSTETEFNPEIFSTRRIIVGPLLSFIGFVAMGAGIIVKGERKEK